MCATEIPLGHSASQAYVFVQLPNPSLSICATILSALDSLSGSPWGSNASCEIFAPTNNIALPFMQVATQAPHAIQDAAIKDSSAFFLSTGIAFATTALPVFTLIYPPACMIRSKAVRSTTRSFITGNARLRQGSTTIVSPSLNARMCNWQVVFFSHGPCALPLIYMLHIPQMPSLQS